MAINETISACLIAKNEAVHLPDCLSSLKGRVDEIVIVDTGSSDNTIELATAAGAVVLHRPWDDDFSAPRNMGLDAATSDWILYIDADERLSAPGTGSIASLLPGHEASAARLRLQPTVGSTCYSELRLFRNDARIRFRQIMHERVVEAVREVCAADGTVVGPALDICLHHVGYEGDQNHKHARNLPILRKAILRNPERVYCWFHLGVTLDAIGERTEAVASLNRAIEKAHAGGIPEELNIAATCHQVLAGVAMDAHNPADALRHAELGLEIKQAHYTLLWAKARALSQLGQLDAAIAILEMIVSIDPESFFDHEASFKKSVFREDSQGLLGSCRFMQGQFEPAARHFELAVNYSGGDLEYVSKAALCRARLGKLRNDS